MQQNSYDYGQDKNEAFDDVTHWVGHLHRQDTDSTKRSTKRNTWWTFKSNILSQELGVEKK